MHASRYQAFGRTARFCGLVQDQKEDMATQDSQPGKSGLTGKLPDQAVALSWVE